MTREFYEFSRAVGRVGTCQGDGEREGQREEDRERELNFTTDHRGLGNRNKIFGRTESTSYNLSRANLRWYARELTSGAANEDHSTVPWI